MIDPGGIAALCAVAAAILVWIINLFTWKEIDHTNDLLCILEGLVGETIEMLEDSEIEEPPPVFEDLDQ